MPIFVYSIAVDEDRPSEADGFVRAETIQEAVALIGHPEVNVYPLPADAVGRVSRASESTAAPERPAQRHIRSEAPST